MRLLRDLWSSAPGRVLLTSVLVVLGAAGSSAAAAAAGPVLVHRSAALFAVLAAATAAAVVCDVAVGLLTAGTTARWAALTRRRLCRVAFGQPLPVLEGTPVGELLDRIDGDVQQVASEVRGSGIRLVQSAALALASLVTALVVWWPAGLGMLLVTALLGAGVTPPARRISQARLREEEAWSDLAAVVEEAVHGQDDVRTSLARPYVLRLYAQRASQVLARGRVVWHRSAAVATAATAAMRGVVLAVVLAGVAALGAGRVDAARLTTIWLLVLGFGITVEHLARMIPELQNALGAWGRILLLADSGQEPAGGRAPAEGDLEVRGLTFRYGDDAPPALREVTLTFRPGRSYALVGRSGSGKSTLAKVLTRAVDVPAGRVLLAGQDVTTLDPERLRRWVALVPQRTEILTGTLADNVTLFDDTLLDRVPAALDDLGLAGWLADLPEGLATRLGDGGHALSAGQAQLVAFARILVRDPHVVVLDEATARMDPVTERRVQRATTRLLRGRIGIVIAHRLSSVERCDEVVVLADGRVAEARPMRESQRFAALLTTSRGGTALLDRGDDGPPPPPPPTATGDGAVAAQRVAPPPVPASPPVRTFSMIWRLMTNDPRYGLASVAVFAVMIVLGLDGAVLPWLWSLVVDGVGDPRWPALGIAAGLLLAMPLPYAPMAWFPEWWVRQMLRISLRLVHGQTGPQRVSAHTPAEVVAQGGDTERVVILADNLVDQCASVVLVVAMTVTSGSLLPAAFFVATMVLSGAAATGFAPRLAAAARSTVAARAAFATALSSALSAASTVKLAGATRPVLEHLHRLDVARNERMRQEVTVQVWARSTPAVISGLLPVAVWALYLDGRVSSAGALVATSVLGAARWFAWTTASLVSSLPSARVWTARTVAMSGSSDYAAPVPGVDLAAGTAPAPVTPQRRPLRRLDLRSFSAVHEDGTVGVVDVDLTVRRGELVLVVGPVGSGKSSLLRALAGIVHHGGTLAWNGEPVVAPEVFLRPGQVSYVAQLPRVLSGTVADNVTLGHRVDAASAVSTAQLDHDLAAAGAAGEGLGLVIGHKGTRLSGGQLQRLALARALAPRTELLVADDVSSALDVTTEVALWQALRGHGVTVVGSTSKRAALTRADRVVVLAAGRVAAQGSWDDLAADWAHLAG